MASNEFLFSVGACPVTPGIEFVYILINRGSNNSVFYCPDCGCAWNSLPGKDIDTVNTLQEIAPEGVRLPTEYELKMLSTKYSLTPSVYWDGSIK